MTVDGDLDIRRQEAAAWFTRLSQRRVSTEDVRAFSAWRRDPRNARAYDRVESVWAASQALSTDPEIAALTAGALGRASSPVRARSLVSRLWKPLGAVVASLLALAVVALWMGSRPAAYGTAVGEQRVVRLADGSRLTLDTASRVEVRFDGETRAVTLLAGQAFFDVADDPERPFVVHAGDARVTAVGTRFDVRRVGRGARVTLVQGRVAVRQAAGDRTWSLSPGEQLETTLPRPVVKAADVARETSWMSGRLIFDATPISAAIAEVNRYSDTRIELRANHIADIPVSGVFDTGDADGFVAALVDLYAIRAEPQPDGTLVLSGPPA